MLLGHFHSVLPSHQVCTTETGVSNPPQVGRARHAEGASHRRCEVGVGGREGFNTNSAVVRATSDSQLSISQKVYTPIAILTPTE